MSYRTFEIKQGNLSPRIETVLEVDGTPLNLTLAAEVQLRMVLSRYPYTIAVSDNATGFAADTTGAVWYQWLAGQTDVAGRYRIEWTVIYLDGKETTVPSKGFDHVEICKRA